MVIKINFISLFLEYLSDILKAESDLSIAILLTNLVGGANLFFLVRNPDVSNQIKLKGLSKVLEKKLSFLILLGTLTLVSCKTSTTNSPPASHQNNLSVADLEIVDCLLPSQVRRLGSSSFLAQRRPTKTTAADCRIRGGEYVEFDRANYATALKVWVPAAEAGDAEAQVNVGEIYERGLNGEPNYEVAAFWYLKAAKQGNSRGQFNLGTLFEQGLGVKKSKIEALNWYRQAWGMQEDSLVFQSEASRQLEDIRNEMEQNIKQKSTQIKLLGKQLQALQKKADQQQASTESKDEIAQLKKWVSELESEKAVSQKEISELPIFRQPATLAATDLFADGDNKLTAKKDQFGKYYALIIGNQDYDKLEDLGSPLRDAARAAKLLEEKYGFTVELLSNVSNLQIMQALNQLNDVLTEDDNLLIYYAGHGSRIKSGDWESGYWLPVNADLPPNDTRWVSNESITRHLSRLKAKRVLVMADSCYAGLLSSAPGFIFAGNNASYSEEYLKFVLPKKSRVLLTSGGDHPVLDNSGQGKLGKGHSVFASALLEQLENNQKIMSGSELFLNIRDEVKRAANAVGVKQTPEFKTIKGAGHEAGSFFFIPI
jgi:hypothetical protein